MEWREYVNVYIHNHLLAHDMEISVVIAPSNQRCEHLCGAACLKPPLRLPAAVSGRLPPNVEPPPTKSTPAPMQHWIPPLH